LANGWFEIAFIVGDAAQALGGSEPRVPDAAPCLNGGFHDKYDEDA